MRIPVRSSLGSERHEVPRPPSQPKLPTGAATSSRRVTTDNPNPQPWLSKSPVTRSDPVFCSRVSWSVVMVSTEGLDGQRRDAEDGVAPDGVAARHGLGADGI